MTPQTRPTPTSPPAGIAGLIDITLRLTELLQQETALIRAMRLKEIAPLQAEKSRLTQLCQAQVKAIDPKTAIPEPLRARWSTISHALGQAAIENERALRVGHDATDRLIGRIVSGIRQRRAATTGYTPRRTAPTRMCMSGVSLDRRL